MAAALDFRSDTVTRPSRPMMDAMMSAPLGDDVWGDDPTLNKLQDEAARMFGKEAALFCPSGTMTNQIAIKVHTSPGDECICADTAHVYCYEGGGIAANSGVQARLVRGDRGRISAEQVASAINASDPHFPRSSLVCLENTTNKGGGAFYSLSAMKSIRQLCDAHGIPMHLDGARVFNAIIASREYSAADLGKIFDTISICLSKGLGCPVGSLLLGSADFIGRARRVRKYLGGGMRQAGLLAGAGLFALEHNIERLADDHAHAKQLGETLDALPWVAQVAPVDTNIVIFTVADALDANSVMMQLGSCGLLVSPMGGGLLRMVTHLDVSHADVEAAMEILRSFKPS